MSLSRIIHHSHSFTRLEIYHHIYFNNNNINNNINNNNNDDDNKNICFNLHICM